MRISPPSVMRSGEFMLRVSLSSLSEFSRRELALEPTHCAWNGRSLASQTRQTRCGSFTPHSGGSIALPGAQALQCTPPQQRQWWRRCMKSNLTLHDVDMHVGACSSGIHCGLCCPIGWDAAAYSIAVAPR